MISDHQYLVTAAHPGQCDRLPESVREPESGSSRGGGDSGDSSEYGRGGDLLQDHGQRAERVRAASSACVFRQNAGIVKGIVN